MEKKIVLIGKSCSGKSTIANILKNYNLKTQLSTTTRPKRNYEVDGIDYNFIDKETFTKIQSNNGFVEVANFNNWFYGLTCEEYEKADILILTPRGLESYIEKFGRSSFIIIYLETSPSLRIKRINERGDIHDTIERRWVADELDFEGLDDWKAPWDLKLSIQNNESINELIKLLKIVAN